MFFGIRWVLKGERQIIILYWHGIKNQPIRKAHLIFNFATVNKIIFKPCCILSFLVI